MPSDPMPTEAIAVPEAAAQPAALRPAGLVSRSIAAGIDLMVASAIMAGGAAATIFTLFVFDVRNLDMSSTGWWFTTTTFLAICVAYLTLCWTLTEKTVGCVVMRLRVTGRKGKRLGVMRALVRAGFCTFFPVGLLWIALSPSRRSLQDAILGTRVIYA